MKFYVYEHWRPDKDIPFYVGKGSNRRKNVFTRNRNPHYANVVAKLARLGMCVEVRMVASDLSEKQAFDLEISRIAFWKAAGIDLVNRTDGGEGPSGWKREEWHTIKLLDAIRGRVRSPETREKISQSLKGQPISEERKAKIGAANKGRKITQEHRAKLSAAQTKFMLSESARENVRVKVKAARLKKGDV
jgi:hypothetical protein